MKNILVVLLAAMALALALVSCGDSSSSAAEKAEKTYNVTEIADKLFKDIKWTDTLQPLEENMVENILGISKDLYSKCRIYEGGVSTAEEIAAFEAVDEAAAGKIQTALEGRIAAQKKSFEDYQPAELPKLNSPVLKKYGKYVFMCISDYNATAEDIIG